MDSLDQVGIIIKIEERFDISIEDTDAEKFFDKKHVTVDDLINELKNYGIINQKKKKKEDKNLKKCLRSQDYQKNNSYIINNCENESTNAVLSFFLLYLSIKYYNNMYNDFINKQKTLW